MKAHFVKPNVEHIEGYQRVDKLEDFAQFSNSECDVIFANDILDSFTLGGIYEAISMMRSKLRMGGHMVVGGTELRLFCKNVINGAINADDASNLIAAANSMHESFKVKHYLQQLGLVVDTASIDGTHYEFKATNPKSHN